MNEEQKNIETCLAENILSEVASVPTDPQFRSLVEESFDPLKQQAAAQAGYDGYKEVVMYHQPYTFTSQVKQMKSNLILLLRSLWRFPFGRGTSAASAAGLSSASAAGTSAASATAHIRSLADMWQHYITRLKGNPEYGIPSRLSQLTDLPDAPALLADRKISEPNAIDGISLANQLTSDAAAALTEIKDTNHGWTMKRAIPSYFSGLKKITLGCKRWEESADRLNPMIIGLTSLEEVVLEDLEYIPDDNIGSRTSCSLLSGLTACHTVWADKLKRARIVYPTGGGKAVMFWNMPALKKVYMRGLDYFNVYRTDNFVVRLASDDSIEELYLGPMNDSTTNAVNVSNQTKLLKIDFPNGLNNSMNLGTWSPTLDSSNLQQFLQNFKAYIAERLADNGSGKTLTLSQEVRNAIHAAEDEYGIENIIITKKGWTISPAPN